MTKRRKSTPHAAARRRETPSTSTDGYWLFALSGVSRSMPPRDPLAGGKWLLFVDRADIDAVWARVEAAVEAGQMGPLAKVSTARPNPRSRPGKHVICVYTADAEDREDVMRVREALRTLGFASPLSYKTDDTTRQGRYEGSGRVAKYYE